MIVFLIWLAVVGCGIANGYFFSNYGWPENLVILLPSTVCAVLLVIHRRITKDWKAPTDLMCDGIHIPFFRISLVFSIVGLIMLLILHEYSSKSIVTCITVAIASFIAYKWETRYTINWIVDLFTKKRGSWTSCLFLIRRSLEIK